jgi:UDP:flavonoid glycosyltransferase YjiC (YdhE family)
LTIEDLAVIRQKRQYRAGIWVTRVLLPLAWALLIGTVTGALHRLPTIVVASAWVVVIGGAVAQRVLFHRAGLPLFPIGEAGSARVPLRRTIYRDVFGLRDSTQTESA